MGYHTYDVILTNGITQQIYRKHGFCEREAVILAQAEAIENARGYEVVSVKQL
jgi:hypothetical protein